MNRNDKCQFNIVLHDVSRKAYDLYATKADKYKYFVFGKRNVDLVLIRPLRQTHADSGTLSVDLPVYTSSFDEPVSVESISKINFNNIHAPLRDNNLKLRLKHCLNTFNKEHELKKER